MLTAAKSSLTIFNYILQTVAKIGKYLMEKCHSEHLLKLLQIFCKTILNFKVIKSTLKLQWVNRTCSKYTIKGHFNQGLSQDLETGGL